MPNKRALKLEFPVPEDLIECAAKINAIDIQGEDWVIEFTAKDEKRATVRSRITGDREQDIAELMQLVASKLRYFFDPIITKDVSQRVANVVDKLYKDNAKAIDAISKIKKSTQADQAGEEESEERAGKIKTQYVQKFFDANQTNILYEAVLVEGNPCFVHIDWDPNSGKPFAKSIEKILLPDGLKPNMELLPPQKDMYLSKPYEFHSISELDYILNCAAEQTFDSLYRRQKTLVSKYNDAGNTHLTIVAADAIFTHFQDKLGQTHYILFVGDNDTGKTGNLIYLQHEGYRGMLDVDITPANIYGFLGTLEEGQGIILEDEADDIAYDWDKMKIYKSGYNAGKKVTRTDITSFGRKTLSYNTFCFKAFTAEEAPDADRAKGFLDRTFVIRCVQGEPPYDITEVTNPAGDKEHEALLMELDSNRKLLFAYRLLHFHDPLPNIELSIKNREKQLCKPLLRLFQDSQCQDEIGTALADLIGQKRGVKRDTLEAKILGVVNRIIAENEANQAQRSLTDNNRQVVLAPWQPNQIPTHTLFSRVCDELNGTYKREGDKSFDTEEHGIITHNRIGRICIDKFGAESKRTNAIRYFEFIMEKLEKARSAYEFPDKVEILRKVGNDIQNNDTGGCGDASDSNDAFLEDTDKNTTNPDEGKSPEVENNSTNEQGGLQDIADLRDSDNSEKSAMNHKNDQNSSHASLPSSRTIIQEEGEEIKHEHKSELQSQLDEGIRKAVLDRNGKVDKGYFIRRACIPHDDDSHEYVDL